ncbi:MAG TPA: 50S ribosomal protein L18 [Candidatus Absconditabacterales bacterium]|nr:50S ribosomal protein L18 [Candidatus Absconditabacterales bacterium]HNG97330.1 50S ribosomal protein L18 [Candidatus Absconditabacterales bacterium]
MNKHKNHLQTVESKHLRRKQRTNVSTKAHLPSFRAIAGKSNMYNELTVVDHTGATIVQKKDLGMKGTKVERAIELGTIVAGLLKEKKVTQVVFDRNGFRFIGRIKGLADGLITGGITI